MATATTRIAMVRGGEDLHLFLEFSKYNIDPISVVSNDQSFFSQISRHIDAILTLYPHSSVLRA